MNATPLYIAPEHAAVRDALSPEDRARVDQVKAMPVEDIGVMMAEAILASYRHILAVREQAQYLLHHARSGLSRRQRQGSREGRHAGKSRHRTGDRKASRAGDGSKNRVVAAADFPL